MTRIGLVFPHQLLNDHEMFHTCDQLFLIEEFLFFRQFNFHKQKLAFHRASMKAFQQRLEEAGSKLTYIESTEEGSDIRHLIRNLFSEFRKESGEEEKKRSKEFEINFIDPTDNWLSKRVKETCVSLNIPYIKYESPLFINNGNELESFFRKDKKSFFQTTFYKQQRKRLGLLMTEEGKPQGGKWTFDTENRKKIPKNSQPPVVNYPENNAVWEEAVQYVGNLFPDNPGEITTSPLYPVDHKEAESWLSQFLDFRFHFFGDYEDAIVVKQSILHHSLLSPLINVGLLLPKEIVAQSVHYAEINDVPLNSAEGFIRQIIGWREFIRGIYEYKGTYSRTRNFWGFKRKIPNSFYTGTTGIDPIDQTIKKVLKTGYCHHIERLMVLGNFMLLCEFDPDEVYRWFMELFIDAYDWVMVPNVYGMSQFSDGGVFATKPYISGSNYLKKMSDYKPGDWTATWDGLFWRFIDQHQDFFKRNPRISMLYYSYQRMAQEKRENHLIHAETFLKSLDQV
ncbi:cryptochrome/photolyase family protein [Lutimonas zeaxanthinifaciens]|uniref:cryptochrome/photolyase family protein n=1 Tax=Lutimonas zeaxanthinifaciens TaxID=3060215 RepID=UPI00265CB529|nr:cryptochrome/photolyase family protein [Lutimonas sp. YSD2104]WKK67178.1 cryptochrome/photolyase family protein [Lutimonas sp. YSD2104]